MTSKKFLLAIIFIFFSNIAIAKTNHIHNMYEYAIPEFFLNAPFSTEDLLKIDEDLLSKSCNLGAAKACYLAGEKYSQISNEKRDFNLAKENYIKGCDFNDKLSCYRLAYLGEKNIFTNISEKEVGTYYKKACNLHDSLSCQAVGLYITDDYKEKREYFNRAYSISAKECDNKSARGCLVQGLLYDFGNYVDKNLEIAESFYFKACSLSDGLACYMVSEFNSEKKNTNLEQQFLRKGCLLKEGLACAVYGEKFTDKNNKYEKLYYLKEACNFNYDGACGQVGDFYHEKEQVHTDYIKAAEYYKKGCDLANSHSCTELAIIYSGAGEDNVENIDIESALLFAEKGCSLNNANGCAIAGFVNQILDEEKAISYYKKACSLKVSDITCGGFGSFYETKKEYIKAKNFYELSCSVNDFGIGCGQLGIMYQNGVGVSKNLNKAKKYLDKACSKNKTYCLTK